MSPENVVSASLTGLAKNEVICIPPLEDAALLDDVEESCRRLWEASTGSAVAKRYGG